MNTFFNELLKLQEEQEKKVSSYEKTGSYEMAYLSLWFVLEKILKIIDTQRNKDNLYIQVCEWKEYLENPQSNKPKDIRSFILKESERIPEIGSIEEYLGRKMPILKEIMNSQSKNGSIKWRDKRNRIAHSAEPFGKKETYDTYRDKILEGISEIKDVIE